MKYEIVELEDLSGDKAKIYSIIPEGEDVTLFERFLYEYEQEYNAEVKNILSIISAIGNFTGARSSFFKIHEGKFGDKVCALYDNPERNLRLYCIRFNMMVVILGGGGYKGKDVRAWQDDEKLSKEANLMIEYSKAIMKQLDDGDLCFSPDGFELQGNFKNYDYE